MGAVGPQGLLSCAMGPWGLPLGAVGPRGLLSVLWDPRICRWALCWLRTGMCCLRGWLGCCFLGIGFRPPLLLCDIPAEFLQTAACPLG